MASFARLRKLRRDPEQFFRDSRSLSMRLLGGLVTRAVLGPERVSDWLDEPQSSIVQAKLPILSGLVLRNWDREARARRELIARHNQPTVSIVMAAFDASATVAEAIASVTQQSYHNLELLIVDDASRDNTAAIAARLADNDRRIRVLRSGANGGAARARNLGLQASTGEFIAFHDADDRAHPERIERQLAALLRCSSARVCLCNGRRVDSEGEPVLVNGRRDYKWVNSMMFPRRVFERIGYIMNLRISEDAEYYERIKLAFGADSEIRLFKSLYFARFSPDSVLFSDGTTAVTARGHVAHLRSNRAEAALEKIRRVHDQMRNNERDVYVPQS